MLEISKKSIVSMALVLTVASVMGACSRSIDLPATRNSQDAGQGSGQSAEPNRPSFSEFSDIPIPTGATMNIERTLVLGAQDSWIGRLVLNAPNSAAVMFDFFKQRSTEFGWAEVTTVRSEISFLTYTRGDRVMTVQIQPKTLSGSEVNITVAPRGTGSTGSASFGGNR